MFLNKKIDRCMELDSLTYSECEEYLPRIQKAKIIRVYDGDTVTIGTILNGKAYRFSVRLVGLDTPEIRSRDPVEKQAALTVRDRLREKIMDKIIDIQVVDTDKYGRLLAVVSLDGENINRWLIDSGQAVEYNGDTKPDWSEILKN